MKPTKQKKLTIILTQIKGLWYLGFQFPYDASMSPIMKRMGYRWDPDRWMWRKPYHHGFEEECDALRELSLDLQWEQSSLEVYNSVEFVIHYRKHVSRR